MIISKQSKKIGLIHTSATLVPVFRDLCEELLQGVETFNIVDDSLIRDVIQQGSMGPSIAKRLWNHIQCAEMGGADLILVTCSSVGEAAEASQAFVSVPVVRVDRPMADLAVSDSGKIGVVATLSTTLIPTVNLIQRRAKHHGSAVEVTSRVCEGAFEALMSGDSSRHDQLVREQIEELCASVDKVVLAQASMARLVSSALSKKVCKPILSSPRVAIESLVPVLQ
ncbi:MAG: aspartate/glutamate racemase family protein [Pirellulales bacterium]